MTSLIARTLSAGTRNTRAEPMQTSNCPNHVGAITTDVQLRHCLHAPVTSPHKHPCCWQKGKQCLSGLSLKFSRREFPQGHHDFIASRDWLQWPEDMGYPCCTLLLKGALQTCSLGRCTVKSVSFCNSQISFRVSYTKYVPHSHLGWRWADDGIEVPE